MFLKRKWTKLDKDFPPSKIRQNWRLFTILPECKLGLPSSIINLVIKLPRNASSLLQDLLTILPRNCDYGSC